MISGNLQNTDILKIEYQQTDGQVRSKTVFLPPKYRKTPLQDNRPDVHIKTCRHFQVLFSPQIRKK